MESGAKGCEVIVSGKLRAQRAKAMKFKDGYMIASGQPVHDFIDSAVRHVLLRQGVLGIKVCLLLSCYPFVSSCGTKQSRHSTSSSLKHFTDDVSSQQCQMSLELSVRGCSGAGNASICLHRPARAIFQKAFTAVCLVLLAGSNGSCS